MFRSTMLLRSRRHGPRNRDRHAVATQAVGPIKDNRLFDKVTDRGQFHASRTMNTKVNTYAFSGTDHFSLSHRKLVWYQMAQVAQPLFDGCAKFGKVHFGWSHTDHKRLWGHNEVSNLAPDQNGLMVRHTGYRRRPGQRLVFKKRLLLVALTLRQSVAIVASWHQ